MILKTLWKNAFKGRNDTLAAITYDSQRLVSSSAQGGIFESTGQEIEETLPRRSIFILGRHTPRQKNDMPGRIKKRCAKDVPWAIRFEMTCIDGQDLR